jgi:hypothetical protein
VRANELETADKTRTYYIPLVLEIIDTTEMRLCLEFVSVPRAKQKTLGKEKNTWQRFLCQEQIFWLWQRNLKKIIFSHPIFFYPQHTLVQNLC